MESLSVAALAAQIVIADVSYITIHRHRSIYGIKTRVLRLPKGDSADTHTLNTKDFDKDLEGGKYTVLHFAVRIDNDLEVIMGQIKR